LTATSPELVQGSSPPRPLYHSPRGLLGFQAEGVAKIYTAAHDGALGSDGVILVFGTGTGKTHLAMAASAILFEDGLIDVVLMVGEKGKIGDFVKDDFPTYTDLTVAAYYGPPAKRARVLQDPPQVLCTNYETGRNDICTFKPKSRAVKAAGPLTEFLRGKRVLVVFDEVIVKMRSRGSQTYLAWDYLINRVLRKTCPFVRVVGMTAYTMEAHPEDHFNLGRVIRPDLACTVDQFKTDHVASWWMDAPGGPRPRRYKNVSQATLEDPGVVPLSARFAPAIVRKSKDDPEIAKLFPRMDERPPTLVELTAEHRRFLKVVDEVAREQGASDGERWGLLWMAAGHPLGLLRSTGWVARLVAGAVGEAGLRQIGSAKVDRLLEWAARLGDDQGVVFTWFGQTVLPVLEQALTSAGYEVAANHGQMSMAARHRSKESFTSGGKQIFLSSDAGCRGLNLGCGRELLHYDPARTYGVHRQRSDRVDRLDSVHSSVGVSMLVAAGTPDEDALDNQLRRHEWTEQVLDEDAAEGSALGEIGLTAEMRRRGLERVRMLR
jgi:hypothetical protein